jgi:hypothetical protein
LAVSFEGGPPVSAKHGHETKAANVNARPLRKLRVMANPSSLDRDSGKLGANSGKCLLLLMSGHT